MTVHVYPRGEGHRIEAHGWCWCQPRCESWHLSGRIIIHKSRHD